ncbi:hypothetical protein [Priestia megaterium]
MDILLFSLGATQPAIEAAKIAAETASQNAHTATKVAIGTAVVSLAGVLFTGFVSSRTAKKTAETNAMISKELGENNIKSLDKRRLIDTISAQRIGWITNTRNQFVEFNKLCHRLSMIMLSKSIDKDSNPGYDFGKHYQEIAGALNHIELLLNPREFFSEQLIIYLNRMFDSLAKGNFDMEVYKQHRATVAFIQQVILKAEWRRIKDETERGEQLTKKEMKKIFKKVAKEIDCGKYEILIQSPKAETN